MSGTTYAAWKLIIPGTADKYFYRVPDTGETGVTALPNAVYEGLAAKDIGVYGDEARYTYTLYGTAVSSPSTRLDKIELYSGHSTSVKEAEIDFDWIDDDSLDNAGKLESMHFYRSDDSWSSSTEIKRVEFRYKADGDGLPDALGTEGDLIEVSSFTRVDDSTSNEDTWRQSVHQYRYHGGEANEDEAIPPDPDGDGFIEDGNDHQMKMEFRPEQIEFFAEEHSQSTGSTVVSVVDGAAELLELDDGEAWFSGSSDIAADLAAKVFNEYETSGEKRLRQFFKQTDCGCTGGSTHGTRYTITYKSFSPTLTHGVVTEAVKIVEAYYNGSTYVDNKIQYRHLVYTGHSTIRRIGTDAIVDASNSSNQWVMHFEYDSSTEYLSRMMTIEALDTFEHGFGVNAPSYSAKSNEGLVYTYSYKSGTSYLEEIRRLEGDHANTGNVGHYAKYDRDSTRPWLVTKSYAYPDSSTTTGAYETSYSYDFHSGDAIKGVTTTIDRETVAQNGPGGTLKSARLYNEAGELIWSKAPDGTLTSYEYDSATSARTKSVRNAENTIPSGTHGTIGGESTSGWGHSGSEDEITTEYEVDIAGRVTKMTRFAGTSRATTTYLRREMRDIPSSIGERQGLKYYTMISLPHVITGGDVSAGGEYDGTAGVRYATAGGRGIASQEYIPEAATNGVYSTTTATVLDTEVGRSYTDIGITGARAESKRWIDLSGGTTISTRYGYDDMGRLHWIESPDGQYTRNTYDIHGRSIKVESGTQITEDGWMTDNAVTISERFYDSGQTATQGVGNGRVEMTRVHESATTTRDTKHYYDYLGNNYKTLNPDAPHTWTEYDDMGRVTKRAVFNAAPTAIDTPLANRVAYSETYYSDRGTAYCSKVFDDPDSTSTNGLETNVWYDDNGRAIKTLGPDRLVTKTTYDSLGRVVTRYQTDGYGDPAPGATSNYDHADDVVGDRVLSQSSPRYIADTTIMDLTTTKRRVHTDQTKTGDLDDFTGATDEKKVITTYAAMYYDDANRPVIGASYGTNTTGFRYNSAAAPTINQASPPTTSTSGVLISETQFDDEGRAEIAIAPDGTKTKTIYDDAGRQVAMIQNYDDAVIEWSSSLDRYEVKSGMTVTEPDTDIVTSFVYDDAGRQVKRVEHYDTTTTPTNDESVQITQYVYGTDSTIGSLTMLTSDIDSADLLVGVRHPQESGANAGEPGDTQEYVVLYGYDRLGRMTEMKDQNGTVHAYTYDSLGRMTKDEVTTFGTGVDQWADTIEYAYNSNGQRTLVTTKDGTTVLNEVKFTYYSDNSLFQVWQDPDGAVVTTAGPSQSLYVQYSYTRSFTDNYIRLFSIRYPSGDTLQTQYGGTTTPGFLTSRPAQLAFDGTVELKYDYVGTSIPVVTKLPTPGIHLDRYIAADGSTSTGIYDSMDQWGRLTSHRWVDSDFQEGTGGNPDRPPLIDQGYTYDKASNHLTKSEDRPGAAENNRDEQYIHDDLGRLTEAKRGVLSGGTISTIRPLSTKLELDMASRLDLIKTEADDNNTYDSSEEDDLVFNSANEMTDFTGANDVTYDDAGNTTEIDLEDVGLPDPSYEYDAWNRVVRVNQGTTEIAVYEYNGLNLRTVIERDDPNGEAPGSGLNQTRHLYYDADWRLLEERISTWFLDPEDPEGLDHIELDMKTQLVWGNRGIDDAIMRRMDVDNDDVWEYEWFHATDAQFSTLALLDDAGVVHERVRYTPYGEARHSWGNDVDGDGDADSTDRSIITNITTNNLIGQSNYRSEADLDRDGDVDSNDATVWDTPGATSALAFGVISDANDSYNGSPENAAGYAGYLFNPDEETYYVRYRTYLPERKRWLQRDPAGYVDGANQYLYGGANPATYIDPMGLFKFQAAARLEGYMLPPVPLGGSASAELEFETAPCCDSDGNPATELRIRVDVHFEAGFGLGLRIDVAGFGVGWATGIGPRISTGGDGSFTIPCAGELDTTIQTWCIEMGTSMAVHTSIIGSVPSWIPGVSGYAEVNIGVRAGVQLKSCFILLGPTGEIVWLVGGRGYALLHASAALGVSALGVDFEIWERNLFDSIRGAKHDPPLTTFFSRTIYQF
ncbi:MAG: RHS repeat-associated core domain-containing protein [Phycisphaerales bacterium JB043]